jgi:hypothetical protein
LRASINRSLSKPIQAVIWRLFNIASKRFDQEQSLPVEAALQSFAMGLFLRDLTDEALLEKARAAYRAWAATLPN